MQMRSLVALAAAVVSVPTLVSAQTSTWTKGSNGNWTEITSWSPAGVPANGSNIVIDAAASNVTVTVNASPTINNVQIDDGDTLSIGNSQVFTILGTLSNDGTLAVTGLGNNTYFAPRGNVTFTGTGSVALGGDNTWLYDVGDGVADTLTNSAGHTIRGRGNVGFGATMALINQGLVQADVNGGTLTLTTNAAGTTNTGTLRASGGGRLALSTSFVNNAGGTVEAQNLSVVGLIGGARINGGTLVTSGTGRIEVSGAGTGAIDGVTNTGSFVIQNAAQLTAFNTITNDGTITLNSVGNNTYLQPRGNVTFAGTGTLVLPGAATWLYDNGDGVADTLINSAGHTIRGRGNIGFSNLLALTNQGLIDADVSGGTMTLTANAAGTTNTGTLRASGGGRLTVSGSFINNTGGTVVAQDASFVTLTGGRINGGTLATSGTGRIEVSGSNSGAIDGVTNTGNLVIQNAGQLTAFNTITNDGTITLNSVGNNTYLQPRGNVTFAGTGTLVLPGAATWLYDNGDGVADTLTNSTGHTIRGRGNIGFSNLLALTNQGLIDADVNAGTMLLSAGTTNTGTLRASGGGRLNVGGSLVNNTGGTIEAQDSSVVGLIGGGRINGGTLVTSGTGRFEVPGSNSGAIDGVTNTGSFVIQNASQLAALNTITNDGTITLNSVGNATYLNPRGSVTFAGTGAVVLTNAVTWLYDNGDATPDTLTNASGHTLRGAGNIGFGNLLSLTNAGTLDANVAGGTLNLTVNSGGWSNAGTVRASNGGTFVANAAPSNFSAGTLTGGRYEVIGASTLRIPGVNVTANASHILLDGPNANFYNAATGTVSALAGLASNAGHFEIRNGRNFSTAAGLPSTGTLLVGNASTLTVNGNVLSSGTLGGGGTIVAPLVQSSAGTVAPGSPAGPLTITGNLEIQAPSTTQIEIASASAFDRLVASGSASIAGTLEVSLLNGLRPARADVFTIVSGASLSGSIGTPNAWGLIPASPGGAFTREITATSLVLRSFVGIGDIDLSGTTNNQDIAPFVALLTGTPIPSNEVGFAADADGNGVVNNQDIAAFVAALTGGRPLAEMAGDPDFAPLVALVPEPGSLALLGLAGLLMTRRRRR
jgi:hypothetical protein